MPRASTFAFLAVACAAAGAMAQDAPPKKDPQSAVEPRSGPGAGQKYLARFAGDWTVAKNFYPRGGGAPVSVAGTCKQTMVHGGRFLLSEFVFERAGEKSTGTGTIGFEPATGFFTSFWSDSRSTRFSVRQSKEPFDGEQIVLHAKGLQEDGKDARPSRTVSKLEEGGGKLVHRQYAPTADGKERLIMELVMTRVNVAPASKP